MSAINRLNGAFLLLHTTTLYTAGLWDVGWLVVTFTQGIRDSLQFLWMLREQTEGKSERKKIKYILPFLKHNQQKKITHWPHEYKTPNLKQIRAVTRVWELASRSPPNQTEIKAACAEKIYNNPKQFSDRRHKTKAALTEQRLLEHCSSSFPETDLSQATQAAAPEGDTGTNWCPLAAPGFSFPSFTSFTFTWKASRKHFQIWLPKTITYVMERSNGSYIQKVWQPSESYLAGRNC